MHTQVADILACSNFYLIDTDNGTDLHSQLAVAELAGISSHPQNMKRVLVMFDPVVQPYHPAINALG